MACCCFTLTCPKLRLREHRALLLGLAELAHFGLFDQLNAPVEGEHFLSLSAGLPGISSANINTFTYTCVHEHLLVVLIFLVAHLGKKLTSSQMDSVLHAFNLEYNNTPAYCLVMNAG